MPETYTVEQVTRNLRHLGDHLKSGRILAWPSSSMPSAAQVAFDAAAMIADLAEQVNEQREAFTKLTAEYEALALSTPADLPDPYKVRLPKKTPWSLKALDAVKLGDVLLDVKGDPRRVSRVTTEETSQGTYVLLHYTAHSDAEGNDDLACLTSGAAHTKVGVYDIPR